MKSTSLIGFKPRPFGVASLATLWALAFVACSTESDADRQVDGAQIQAAEKRWQANKPTHFAYKLAYSCFCPYEDRGPFLVEAHRDSVVHVRRIRTNYPIQTDGTVTYDTLVITHPGQSHSIDSLFNLVRQAVAEDNSTEIVEFDPTWGFPKSVITEIGPQVEDDYWEMIVSEFRVLSNESN